jgi:hypothetical protein
VTGVMAQSAFHFISGPSCQGLMAFNVVVCMNFDLHDILLWLKELHYCPVFGRQKATDRSFMSFFICGANTFNTRRWCHPSSALNVFLSPQYPHDGRATNSQSKLGRSCYQCTHRA